MAPTIFNVDRGIDMTDFIRCDDSVFIDSDTMVDVPLTYTYDLTVEVAALEDIETIIDLIEHVTLEGVHDSFCPLRVENRRRLATTAAVSMLPKDELTGVSCGDNCFSVSGYMTLRTTPDGEKQTEDIVCEIQQMLERMLNMREMAAIPGVQSTAYTGDPNGSCQPQIAAATTEHSSQDDPRSNYYYVIGAVGFISVVGAIFLLGRREDKEVDPHDEDDIEASQSSDHQSIHSVSTSKRSGGSFTFHPTDPDAYHPRESCLGKNLRPLEVNRPYEPSPRNRAWFRDPSPTNCASFEDEAMEDIPIEMPYGA